jgi:hypothetical protein
MRNFALPFIAALAIAGPAFGADMTVLKAPPAFPYATSGFYAGVYTGANVAQTNMSGTNLLGVSLVQGSVAASGGEVGVTVGWVKGSIEKDSWWGLDGRCGYQNVTASVATAGASVSAASRWSCMGGAMVSASLIKKAAAALPNLGLNGITTAFPGFTPVPPPGANVGTAHEFFEIGGRAQGISGNFGGVDGSSVGVAPMLMYGAIWENLDTNGRPTGTALRAAAWTAFPEKGATFNGLFGPGNPTIGSGVAIKQQWGVTLDWLIGG